MKKNVGKTDKIIRTVLAVVFAYLGYTVNPWFYLAAAIALITAITGMCAIYQVLGMNTKNK